MSVAGLTNIIIARVLKFTTKSDRDSGHYLGRKEYLSFARFPLSARPQMYLRHGCCRCAPNTETRDRPCVLYKTFSTSYLLH